MIRLKNSRRPQLKVYIRFCRRCEGRFVTKRKYSKICDYCNLSANKFNGKGMGKIKPNGK